ncbi:hypothetical protein QR674_06580 [Acinetobacter chinensis]|uniref:Uncharacterized protein n=1 Tax=Acinetobacter chinensis TaxID=2004650 RepID=A0ABU3WE06_9GAMM|nr:hypothetical protein [Acinetobacter chinensis]MDV2468644.1 hypothetical protein [Acinetobacter chinensis]
MNKTRIILLTLLSAVSTVACAEKKPQYNCTVTSPKWAKEFNKVYQLDEFRVYYSDLESSTHRLPQTSDINNNKIPDYVENIAIQAMNSRDMFKLAGFRSPLDSPRYQNSAESIAIFLQKTEGNGVAFERAARYPNLSINSKDMPCSISIVISNNLEGFPGSWATVTHELFHLYQYGYAQFKNSWYLESLANWADRAMKIDITNNTKRLPPLPQTRTEINQDIFGKAYTHIWRRLFLINDSDILEIPEDMLKRRYVGGSKVFLDNEWRGTHFVLTFMQNLEKESNRISAEKKWEPYHWKEKDQRSKEWDPLILQLIQKQLKQPEYDQKEIRFMRNISIPNLKSE